jgi:hypothetical protein
MDILQKCLMGRPTKRLFLIVRKRLLENIQKQIPFALAQGITFKRCIRHVQCPTRQASREQMHMLAQIDQGLATMLHVRQDRMNSL